MTSISCRFLLLGIAGLALLSACGGGGGGDAPPMAVQPPAVLSDVPGSATASAAGAVAFVRQLAARSDDTSEPIRIGDAVLATSDTDEPAGL
jgi:hypothetical protein